MPDYESVRLQVQILPGALFMESKPQETGTRLLTGEGEVATTSDSTAFYSRIV
jgi:hypothetical protein